MTPEEITRKKYKAKAPISLGKLEEYEALYDAAIQLYLQALHVYQDIQHQEGIVLAMENIANVHQKKEILNQLYASPSRPYKSVTSRIYTPTKERCSSPSGIPIEWLETKQKPYKRKCKRYSKLDLPAT